jgi:transcription antitermination factor NusG
MLDIRSASDIYELPVTAEARKLAWFALRVKSNREKVVADAVQWKGYETFLPLYQSRRRWSERYKDVSLPLFPGYVFSRFDIHDRLPLLIVPGVVNVVRLGKVPIAVDDTEIDDVRTLVASGLGVQPWPFLGLGERVSVEEGPLRGVTGVVTAFKGALQLVVSIALLQRSVAVAVDRRWVRPESRNGVSAGLIRQAQTA